MMIIKDSLYIDGKWTVAESPATIDVANATTEEVFAVVPEGSERDIDKAVAAARRAFDRSAWASADGSERAAVDRLVRAYPFAEIIRAVADAERGKTVKAVLLFA